jgi:hypothetical protein
MKRDTLRLSLAITCRSRTNALNFNDALPMARLHGLGSSQARSSDLR